MIKFDPIYHTVFESLACIVGFRLYTWLRKRDTLTAAQRMPIIAGCCLGAVAGAKAINFANDPAHLAALVHSFSQGAGLQDLAQVVAGKGVVGALIGGWAGVEITKALLKVRSATGDSFVIPLAAGIMIGRIGCFLCGLYDRTYGIETTLPWGVDFGDGQMRHPLQLYEIIFLAVFLASIRPLKSRLTEQGDLFKLFMCAYLTFRFFSEMLKPVPHIWLGFDAEQVVAICVVLFYWRFIVRLVRGDSIVQSQ